MTKTIEVLEAEVNRLPSDHVADWIEAWMQEADRREAAIAAGTSVWLPGEEVVERVRKSLG